MDRPIYVIITAGGVGMRMGSSVPKQFLELDGKPILLKTIELFASIPKVNILLVLHKEQKEFWKKYCLEKNIQIRHRLITGGVTRFHSVKNAVDTLPDGALVAVHDGVRPFVPKAMLERMLKYDFESQGCCGVIPVMQVVESMRKRDENMDENGVYGTVPVDRSGYLFVQTPQIFDSTELKRAYKQAYIPSFTDDASVVQSAGGKIALCDGSRLNIKITTPEDLEICKLLLPLL